MNYVWVIEYLKENGKWTPCCLESKHKAARAVRIWLTETTRCKTRIRKYVRQEP
ncbi:hypothetical protein UFOVP1165_25 [uncultured Caudovirales phage]|uniref:Uncharacterized protein n=1 Tax=uncultured Caudovirales phage TaxID=2100421 RepID=A0A6J5QWI6_9CAUD|nr:hypothetical protein UFOVP1165_25 [uncultured Caudovirales phage]